MSYKVELAQPARERLEAHLAPPLLLRIGKHLQALGENPRLGRKPPPGPLEDLGMIYTFTIQALPLSKTVTVFYRFSVDEESIQVADVQVGRL